MAEVATYLNFDGNTEEAFEFYRQVFGTEYSGDGPSRYGDMPPDSESPQLSDEQKQQIMHVSLPILGGHVLMGTDVMTSFGQSLTMGDNASIMLMPDSRSEADELFAKLSDGGSHVTPMQDMFWGDYYGACRDRFGVCWMVDVPSEPQPG